MHDWILEDTEPKRGRTVPTEGGSSTIAQIMIAPIPIICVVVMLWNASILAIDSPHLWTTIGAYWTMTSIVLFIAASTRVKFSNSFVGSLAQDMYSSGIIMYCGYFILSFCCFVIVAVIIFHMN
jgi:hypothetical protein